MSEQLQKGDAPSIEAAVVAPPRRWLRRILLAGFLLILAAAAIVTGWYILRPERELDCEIASRTEPPGTAVVVCQREYERTRAPADGVRLAEALLQSRETAAASAIADELLATERRSDALRIRGEVAFAEGRLDAAFEAFHSARDLHRKENRRAELAKDARALARCHLERDQFAEALYALDECVAEASAASDRSIEGLCRINAARTLTLVGYFEEARAELGRATRLVSHDREVARLLFEHGNIEQELSRGLESVRHEELAISHFEKALEHALSGNVTEMVLGIELNLSFSLAEARRLEDAERHLEMAATLDRKNDFKSEREQLAARIAYRSGNLTLASSLNEQVYPSMEAGDDRFEICVMQARIALALNDPRSAEKWARRGIEEVEQIRAGQTAVGLRPWVLGTRRAPYELLFSVLARAGRLEEAVAVFDAWQGRTLLDTLAPSRMDPSSGLAGAARKLQSFAKWLPAASRMPLMTTGGRAVVEALRTTDLFALAIAEGVLWRVTASRGRIRIDELGTYDDALQDRLAGFLAAPTDRTLADDLGEHLVPAELFGDPSTLHVVLDARLVMLPVVALRRGGRPLIAARPVLHAPRLPAGASCVAPVIPGGATVLADPLGNLPDARRESDQVATLFKTRALVGAEATSTALFAAKSAPVLHVAVHAEVGALGGVLELHDRHVSALEIAAVRLGPPLVILASCNSARSADPELASSLSTAFLTGGSSQVIATLREVTDAGAREITSRFYAEGGTRDPVRTLAAIQAKLAESGNEDWPLFAVFGHDVCR